MGAADVPVVSNVSGRVAGEGEMMCVEYWCEHIVKPVRFMDGMHALEGLGCGGYVEMGPQGVLVGMGRRCVSSSVGVVWGW